MAVIGQVEVPVLDWSVFKHYNANCHSILLHGYVSS